MNSIDDNNIEDACYKSDKPMITMACYKDGKPIIMSLIIIKIRFVCF